MTEIKYNNIIRFTILFLSGDLNLLHESPDYIIEKFEKYFGKNFQIKETHIFDRLYIEHNKIWNHDDYRINSIFNFLLDIIAKSEENNIEVVRTDDAHYTLATNNIKCKPDDYINSFRRYIGEPNNIYNFEQDGLHHVLIRDLFNVYNETTKKYYPEFHLRLHRLEKLEQLNKI